MSNKEYKTSEYVVAFIDILGSSDAIKKDADNSLNVVHRAYEKAIEEYEGLFENISGHRIKKPISKIFSDNIVVAIQYSQEKYKRSAFLATAMISAMNQIEFLNHGWLTRGGIAAGSFFCDEIMVWGKALVSAYELENKVAVYPRVVIDPDLIRQLNLALADKDDNAKQWIRQDRDGLFYIEYLNNYLKNLEIFIISEIERVDENIVENVKSIKVCQKWIWLGSYLKERLAEIIKESSENNGKTNEEQRD